jgi:hypothetical protein
MLKDTWFSDPRLLLLRSRDILLSNSSSYFLIPPSSEQWSSRPAICLANCAAPISLL